MINIPQYDHIELTDREISAVLRVAWREKMEEYKSSLKEGERFIPSLVEITEEEKPEILRLARRAKEGILYEQKYIRKISQKKEQLRYSAEQLKENILANGFIRTEYNKGALWQLCLYFTGDTRFNGDLQKGIYLQGPVGCGKTLLLKLFRHNQIHSYIVKSCREISYEFAQDGFNVLLRYGSNLTFSENKFGHENFGICMDDLGTDDVRGFYANKVNPLLEILQQRYDRGLFSTTHITTNLDADQLEDIYGTRIRSRTNEMFTTIAFDENAPDMRKISMKKQ